MSDQHATPAGALWELMRRHQHYLRGQRGQPAHGHCRDCDRMIPATELYAKCPRCASPVCVGCLNTHPCAAIP